MIVEGLFDFFFDFIINLFPSVNISIPPGIITGAVQAFQVVFYIVPMATVFSIIAITLSLHAFRIVVALIKTLWDLLPIA